MKPFDWKCYRGRFSPAAILASGLLVFAWCCLPSPAAAQKKAKGPDPTLEPPLEFTLEIDGKPVAVPIHLDKPFNPIVNGKKVSMTLSVKPHRLFRHSGVTFQYPQYYVFEADADEGDAPIWTFSGNDNVLILARYPKGDDADHLKSAVDSAVAQYGKPRVKQSDCTLTLDDRKLDGKRLDVRLAEVAIRQELYAFTADRYSFVLIVQDTPEENKQPTEETAAAIKMLEESFKIAKPAEPKKKK
jgi:hypothetical protein